MDATVIQIIITIVGGGAFFSFIQFLIQRRDSKDDRFKQVEEKLVKGLEERETTGRNRYMEHKQAIEQMGLNHQKEFLELQKAIDQLTANDTKITSLIETNQNSIEVIAGGVVGMIHNTIIHSTDPIIRRGAVTYEELTTLDSLYQPYSKLGGNGECKRRYEDVNKLPKISKEEAALRDREIEKQKFRDFTEAS